MWRNIVRCRVARYLAVLCFALAMAAMGPNAVAQDVTATEGECACQRPLTFTAGQLDNCQLPTESGFRRTELDNWPSAVWKEFDDPAIDRWVAHTFASLPLNIVSASLEVTMEPSCSTAAPNDTINIVLDGTFAFNSTISALPEAGGTWDCANNDKTLFTFDLDALGLTPQVATDRYLDFLVQDDTTVDGARLLLQYCPPPVQRVYRRGRVDNFQAPTDPVFRRGALDNTFSVPWNAFDDPRINRHVGCSFINLPSDLLSADLEVRMAPRANNADNDTFTMVLVNGSEQFGSAIVNLPESGGSWVIGDPPALFDFDLDALGLLSQVNADGYLDFRVQDDTEIDFARLEISACGPLSFGGWPCIAVGDAQLYQPTEEVFSLFGIDDEGDDGVRIEVGEAEGFCLEVEPVCLSRNGTAIEMVSSGRIFTVEEDMVEGRMRFVSDGVNVGVDATFDPPFDQNLTVVVKDGSALVGSQTGMAPGQVATLPATACIAELDDLDTCLQVLFSQPIDISIEQGGPTLMGDRLQVCRQDIVGMTPVVQQFDVLFAGVDAVQFNGALLQLFEHLLEPLGDARLEAFGGDLTLDNLGSSGEDGVAIQLDEAESFDVDFLPLDNAAFPLDAAIDVQAFGSLDGLPEQSLGTLSILKTSEGMAFGADFTGLGSPTQRIQVLSGGSVVTDISGHSGIAAIASNWPHGLGKLGGQTECYVGHFPPSTIFDIDGALFSGDELRILSEGSSVVDFKSRWEMRLQDIPQLTLIGAASTGQDDLNGALFLDGFESGDTSAWSSAVP